MGTRDPDSWRVLVAPASTSTPAGACVKSDGGDVASLTATSARAASVSGRRGPSPLPVTLQTGRQSQQRDLSRCRRAAPSGPPSSPATQGADGRTDSGGLCPALCGPMDAVAGGSSRRRAGRHGKGFTMGRALHLILPALGGSGQVSPEPEPDRGQEASCPDPRCQITLAGIPGDDGPCASG